MASLFPGPLRWGETITVDVFLSVDAGDDPLPDIRSIVFDFTATSDTIEVSQFAWTLALAVGDDLHVKFENLPSPSIVYTAFSRAEGLILDLSTVPVLVAGFDATVTERGSLNVIGSVDGGFTSAAEVHAGFDARVVFSLADATLSGGQLELTVDGAGGDDPDSDGDGVPDSIDAFPDDPFETTDSDGDGVGDVADAFPDDPTQSGDDDTGGGSPDGGQAPGLCGAGAAPAMILMLLTFGGVRTRRRG